MNMKYDNEGEWWCGVDIMNFCYWWQSGSVGTINVLVVGKLQSFVHWLVNFIEFYERMMHSSNWWFRVIRRTDTNVATWKELKETYMTKIPPVSLHSIKFCYISPSLSSFFFFTNQDKLIYSLKYFRTGSWNLNDSLHISCLSSTMSICPPTTAPKCLTDTPCLKKI